MNPCGQACAGNDTGVSGKGSSVSVTWRRNKTFILNYLIKAAIVVWFLKKDGNFLQFCQASNLVNNDCNRVGEIIEERI